MDKEKIAYHIREIIAELGDDPEREGLKDTPIAGFADTRPVASNDLPEGRALNRRVDIIVVRADVNYYNQKN